MKLIEIFPQANSTIILVEMPNFRIKQPGLNFIFFISTKAYVKGRHGPRIKISNNSSKYIDEDCFTITIDKK